MNEGALERLEVEIEEASGEEWTSMASHALGRSTYREHYAFYGESRRSRMFPVPSCISMTVTYLHASRFQRNLAAIDLARRLPLPMFTLLTEAALATGYPRLRHWRATLCG